LIAWFCALRSNRIYDDSLLANGADYLTQIFRCQCGFLYEVLEDHRYSPWNSRWRNWHWARVARRLLEEANQREKMQPDVVAKESQS